MVAKVSCSRGNVMLCNRLYWVTSPISWLLKPRKPLCHNLPSAATVVAVQQKLTPFTLKRCLAALEEDYPWRRRRILFILHVDFLPWIKWNVSSRTFSSCLGVLNCSPFWPAQQLSTQQRLHFVLELNDLKSEALYLGVRIKTFYLGLIESQVKASVMGTSHMLAKRTWAPPPLSFFFPCE